MLRGLASVVFPNACLGCGAHVGEGALPLCTDCLFEVDDADPAALAVHLAASGAPLDGAWAAWRYRTDGPLAPVVHAIKYGHRPALARRLGAHLAPSAPALPEDAVLVPLPLTRRRWLERGYNQAEEIARGVSDATGHAVRPDLLARAAFVRSQTRLDRAARRENVAHAFTTAPDVAARSIVLVDDVVTTGATASAAAVALHEAGAASVSLWALAWTA